jgi:hypothetical protein
MIRKFFDNKIGSLTLVILVIMLIRIPIYFVTQYQPSTTLNTGILSNFINEINSVRWLSFVLSFMVVIIEGLIVNKLCWEYNIVEKPGYVILYFFAIINSCFLENFYFIGHILATYIDDVIIFAKMMPAKSFQLSTKKTLYGFSFTLLLSMLLSLILSFSSSEKKHIDTFQKKLHQKEIAVENLIIDFAKQIEVSNYADLFKNQLISYKSLYNTDGFVLLVYENDSLKFWSDNHIPVENFLLKICLDSKIVKLNK